MNGISAPLDRVREIEDAAALISLVNDPLQPTLVLFTLGEHAPGKRLEERLLNLPFDDAMLNLARVDVDRLPALAQSFGVTGAPALVLFRSGQAAARRLGEIEDGDLRDWIEGELAA